MDISARTIGESEVGDWKSFFGEYDDNNDPLGVKRFRDVCEYVWSLPPEKEKVPGIMSRGIENLSSGVKNLVKVCLTGLKTVARK